MKRKNLFSLKLVGAALLPCLFSVNAFALSGVPGYPDNVSQVSCSKTPNKFEFAINPLYTSTQKVPTYCTPLVGDVDGDGNVEIVTASDSVPFPSDMADYVFKNVSVFGIEKDKDGTSKLNQKGYIPTPYFKWDQPIAIGDPDGAGGEPPYIFVAADSTYSYRTGTVRNAAKNSLYVFAYKYDKEAKKYVQAWKSDTPMDSESDASPIQIADLNNDGIAELIIGTDIFNAQTGHLLAKNKIKYVPPADVSTALIPGTSIRSINQKFRITPFIGNLLGDKGLELAYHDSIYSVDLKYINAFNKNAFKSIKGSPKDSLCFGVGNPVGADFNGDGMVDLVQVMRSSTAATDYSTYRIAIWDVSSGKILASATTPIVSAMYGLGVPVPLVGDVNNDGVPEICFIVSNKMYCYSYNGKGTLQEYWGTSITDASGITGITLFDFNQDGNQEIVYRDENTLHILDGSVKGTCSGKASISNCFSGTGYEMPVVADVNGDNAAEIITVGGDDVYSNYYGSLRVYASGNDSKWAPARPVWNQTPYNVVNVNKDLTIPKEQFNPATKFSNGKRPFNAYLQQATELNQDGNTYNVLETPTLSSTLTPSAIM